MNSFTMSPGSNKSCTMNIPLFYPFLGSINAALGRDNNIGKFDAIYCVQYNFNTQVDTFAAIIRRDFLRKVNSSSLGVLTISMVTKTLLDAFDSIIEGRLH
jgi:hypothetical protein